MITRAILILTFLFSSSTYAEESFRPNMYGFSKKKEKLVSYLNIELDFLHSSKPSDINWHKLARIYERYVELFCYDGRMKGLERNNPSVSKTCKHYLTKLNKYHPNNLLYICAKKGLRTRECNDAYLDQSIARQEDFIAGGKQFLELEEKLYDVDSGIEIDKLSSAFTAAKAEFNKKENPKNWNRMKKANGIIINYYCSTPQVSFVNFEPPDFMNASNLLHHEKFTSDKLYMSVYELQRDPNRLGNLYAQGAFEPKVNTKAIEDDYRHPFEKEKNIKIKEFTPNEFWRIRTLTKDCFDVILEGLKFNSHLPSSICSLHGQYSPLCLKAKENFNEHVPSYISSPKKKHVEIRIEKF